MKSPQGMISDNGMLVLEWSNANGCYIAWETDKGLAYWAEDGRDPSTYNASDIAYFFTGDYDELKTLLNEHAEKYTKRTCIICENDSTGENSNYCASCERDMEGGA